MNVQHYRVRQAAREVLSWVGHWLFLVSAVLVALLVAFYIEGRIILEKLP